MSGRLLISLMLGFALIFGAVLWYFQNYAFYYTLPAPDAGITGEAQPTKGVVDLRLTRLNDAAPEAITVAGFQGIDADTSPLKFRACFTFGRSIPMMTETYVIYQAPTPLKAPVWFDCFDSAKLTDDLQSGTALAFLGQADIQYGVDRVIAVYDDGRSYAWNQINACGEAVFAGEPLPAHCPKPPER